MHGVKYRSECLWSSSLHIPAMLGMCVATWVRGHFHISYPQQPCTTWGFLVPSHRWGNRLGA